MPLSTPYLFHSRLLFVALPSLISSHFLQFKTHGAWYIQAVLTVCKSAAFLLTVTGMRNDNLLNSIPRGLKSSRSLTGCLGCYQSPLSFQKFFYTGRSNLPEFPPLPPQPWFAISEDSESFISMVQMSLLAKSVSEIPAMIEPYREQTGSRPRYIVTQNVLSEVDLGCSNNPFVNVQQEITPLPLSLIKSVRVTWLLIAVNSDHPREEKENSETQW